MHNPTIKFVSFTLLDITPLSCFGGICCLHLQGGIRAQICYRTVRRYAVCSGPTHMVSVASTKPCPVAGNGRSHCIILHHIPACKDYRTWTNLIKIMFSKCMASELLLCFKYHFVVSLGGRRRMLLPRGVVLRNCFEFISFL
jgi:hypothetical protein